MAPQSDPQQLAFPGPLCSALSSLLFITNRQEPVWVQPGYSWWTCNPRADLGTIPQPLKLRGVPSTLCSTHHLLVYRPHALMRPWTPWKPGGHLSWSPHKVLGVAGFQGPEVESCNIGLSVLYLTEHNMFSRSIHVGAYFKIEFLYRPPVNKSVSILFC